MDTQVASSLKKEKKKEWFLNFHEKHLVVLQNKSHKKNQNQQCISANR